MKNRTLLDAFEAFENSCSSNNISLFQSALFRFTLPGLGGQQPSGSRLTSKELAAARKMLDSTSISTEIEERLRKAQKETFTLLNTPKERQRQPKYYLNQFIEWAIKNRFFPSVELPEENEEYTFYPEKIHWVKTTNRGGVSKKFIFSFEANDYKNEPLNIKQVQQHLNRIKEELNKFESYQITILRNRAVTVRSYTKNLQKILGWLYQGGSIPLAELSFNKIVPFIKLDLRINEFSREENPLFSYMIAKAKTLEEIKDKARYLVNLMKEFFGWLDNPPSPRTEQAYIETLIAYSKYVYRDETDEDMALDFADVPIVNRLKVFHRKLKNGKKDTSKKLNNKYLPWDNIINVLKKLKFEADLETKKNSRTRKVKRSLSGRAKSLQSFVLLGFFILVPPPRQRVVRELELGRTLKYGLFENGRFIPAEKMANSSEAKYYIDLQPEDYKTGDSYGEWLGEFPNVEFADGSKFYEYINRWLFQGYQDKESGEWYGMRELVASAGEKTVFIRKTIGRSHNENSMGGVIKRIFIRWTGVPITPHDLRKLYRTYIDNPETKATVEERESAAFWMRHSTGMAEEVYSHLECEQKLLRGGQMAARLNKKLLKSEN